MVRSGRLPFELSLSVVRSKRRDGEGIEKREDRRRQGNIRADKKKPGGGGIRNFAVSLNLSSLAHLLSYISARRVELFSLIKGQDEAVDGGRGAEREDEFVDLARLNTR